MTVPGDGARTRFDERDVVLIGGGIMSATLGALLTRLQPDWSITMFERLDAVAQESSAAWNNAGTGHSALCELNYTPRMPDGHIDISKAVSINEELQVSKQFWSALVERGLISSPQEFINPVPHVSFVSGADDVQFLRERHALLREHPLFAGMEYTEDPAVIKAWAPLMSTDRDFTTPVAMTRAQVGTDVDFGSLTRHLVDYVTSRGAELAVRHEVTDLTRARDGRWEVAVTDLTSGERSTTLARFVFIGSGGGALTLLQKTGISESKGLGGFPVSGQWLRCTNPEVIAAHHAKVYGKAAAGAPPMSVPHLDTRVIDGRQDLLFGPYAGFSPKFLKNGKLTDLLRSVKAHNLLPLLSVGLHNVGLVRYLVGQVLQSRRARLRALQEFVPAARMRDWELVTAGQRVQVIAPRAKGAKGPRGTLQFGTELVTAADGSVAALLGASPGASTAVPVMLKLLATCFPDRAQAWRPVITELIPSYGQKLAEHPELLSTVHRSTEADLELAGTGGGRIPA
ncbi:MAG: malate:quinone oxidoreductase [Mycobacteriaceae bacterium]